MRFNDGRSAGAPAALAVFLMTATTAFALLAMTLAAAAHAGEDPAAGPGPGGRPEAPAVAAGRVFSAQALPGRRHPARVVSPAEVAVTPRISGEIIEQRFADGARVEKGAVLYRLDDVRYKAELQSARGELSEAEAELAYAKTALARAKSLWERQAQSRETYDAAVRSEKTAAAAVEKARASVTLAEDDLQHTMITSPVAGRAGVSAFPAGSWVTSSSGALVTVLATDPMRVRFAVSMRDVLARFGSVEKLREAGRAKVELADGTELGIEGRVVFTSNAAGADTDTLDVYAEFANPDERLVAGSTVSVVLERAEAGAFAAVPPSAVMHDAEGAWVWVIGEGNRVAKRRIEVLATSDSAAIVGEGLAQGERVVTDGTHKPSEGGVVRVVKEE